MDKHQRYRLKCRSEGRCPHCGKPCAPFAECDDRRAWKGVHRVLSRGVKDGIFKKTAGGYQLKDATIKVVTKVSGRKGDRRFLPKFAYMPTDPEEAVEWALFEGPLTEEQIIKKIGQIRVASLAEFRSPHWDKYDFKTKEGRRKYQRTYYLRKKAKA